MSLFINMNFLMLFYSVDLFDICSTLRLYNYSNLEYGEVK